MPNEFPNAGLFLRLGLPPTVIHHENGDFRTGRYLKTRASRLSVRGKHFENGAFMISSTQIQNDRRLLRFKITPA